GRVQGGVGRPAAGRGPVAPGRHGPDQFLAAHRLASFLQNLRCRVQGAELLDTTTVVTRVRPLARAGRLRLCRRGGLRPGRRGRRGGGGARGRGGGGREGAAGRRPRGGGRGGRGGRRRPPRRGIRRLARGGQGHVRHPGRRGHRRRRPGWRVGVLGGRGRLGGA